MISYVDGITKALFVNKFATPGELRNMSYRELTYYHDAAVEHARAQGV